MFGSRSSRPAPLWGIAGRAGYVLACIASLSVLVASGYSYNLVKNVDAIGRSNAIVSGPSIGAMNILLMGLESRTDWNGNILPDDVLSALHACSRQGVENGCGGNATNTLILIHIFPGGKKAVGISIPRDDWVQFPQPYDGQSAGKIDQAYGLAMAAKENELLSADGGKMTNQIAFAGNEAGRAAAVATVEQVIGQHVDHFAEVNLFGFYELAKVFGGVNVCLNHPVKYDPYSGFFAHHAGLQHLDAKGALAFVRQRHGLTNGDLDRTHRQQAFIDSILHQMRTQGMLDDIGKINSLLSVASSYVITDSGWQLLDFATEMRSLTPKNITFYTLPVVTTDGHMAGQDVNIIDPVYVKQYVQEKFHPAPTGSSSGSKTKKSKQPPATPSSTTVDVYNGGQTPGLASQVSAALAHGGYLTGKIGNTAARATTAVLYGSGVEGSADAIARDFGVTAQASARVAPGHVEVLLGANATAVPTALSGNAGTVSASPSATSVPSTAANDGQAGGAVRSIDGIPCVN